MKAVLKKEKGVGFVIEEIPTPSIGDDEILVKVEVASICGTDVHIYEWNDWAQNRIKPPIVVGHEFAGVVVEKGKEVKRINVGDFVSAETHIYCNHCDMCLMNHREVCRNLKIIGVDIDGAFAEYVKIPERVAWVNPKEIPHKFASIQEPLGNAVDTVLAEDISGKTVLITGAGPIGLLAIAVSRIFGATKIIATDLSNYHLEIAKKVGADVVVNPLRENIYDIVLSETHGLGVDVSLEMSGSKNALRDALKLTKYLGRVSLLGLFDKSIDIDLTNDVIFKKLRIYGITGRRIFETWETVSLLLSSKRLDVSPIITHEMKFEDIDKGIELMKSHQSGKILLYP
ncbi:MAG: L-threonine 3-dehydrogenase [Caldisericaceae bacterium]